MEERRTENTNVSPATTQEVPNTTDSNTVSNREADLETQAIPLEEHVEVVSDEEVPSDAVTADSDAVLTNETEENENPEGRPPLTLEEAQDLCCISFNNALYLSQFPEIQSHLQQQIAANIKENPEYAMAVENVVNFLAAHVAKKEVASEAGKPLTTQYQCSVSSCKLEQSVECVEGECKTDNPESLSSSAPSLTA